MWRAAICISAALLFGFPTLSRAQYYDTDRQNPTEYTDEDSQPLALAADLLYPIGFAAEWLVARPLHYLSHDSAVAPVFKPVDSSDNAPPPPVPIIPDNTLSSAEPAGQSGNWSPSQVPQPPVSAAPAPRAKGYVPTPKSQEYTPPPAVPDTQPAYH
ncbi:MAG: hypothetical protein JWM69_152 [Candidatus Binatus sp.]|jgi:hypothetical protein|nr:hypothetical protein [Candidatus Binatus sp.]